MKVGEKITDGGGEESPYGGWGTNGGGMKPGGHHGYINYILFS